MPRVREVFVGRAGLRAGWGLLLFFALLVALRIGQHLVESRVLGLPPARTAEALCAEELVRAGLVLAVTGVMARLERRPVAEYGLAPSRATRLALEGALLGFVTLGALVAILRALGFAEVHRSAESAASLLLAGVVWAAAFVGVAVFEELALRGYPQAALARAFGFWPAAVVWSVVFGLLHLANPGETALGIAQAAGIALFFCLSLRLTGSLWWAIGYHAAWDWAETFFYGSANSGLRFPGHLLETTPRGPDPWSGGPAGPEGSVLALLVLMVPAGLLWWRRRRMLTA
ncbi:MAG: protease self-immunity family protein [Labilithrix sp.]|nr:protease self-immunity family protein [Labilithrix sp.]